jgi:hypothetical protein
MKKWSDNLIELSKEHLNYSGTMVKSLNGDFGILNISGENFIYNRCSNAETVTAVCVIIFT